MKKTIGFFGLLALGVVVLLAPSPAQAACGTGLTFGQGSLECGGGYCYVYRGTVGTDTTPATIQATFWDLGAGNTTIGAGTDNGNYSDESWIVTFGGSYSLLGNWDVLTVDGCPNANPDPADREMVVQLSDVDPAGNGHFAVVCVNRDNQASTQFDQSKLSPRGHIVLKQLPKVTIASSVRAGNEATITVNSPDFSSIYYSDGSSECTQASVIPQYEVWMKQVARDGAAPTDHDSTSGGWVLKNTCNVGSTCAATTACATTNCDVFIAVAPRYNSSFPSGDAAGKARLSANSTRVQAGPVLAEPVDFKVIKKSTKDTKQPTRR